MLFEVSVWGCVCFAFAQLCLWEGPLGLGSAVGSKLPCPFLGKDASSPSSCAEIQRFLELDIKAYISV